MAESPREAVLALKNLNDGWLDGEGVAPSHDGLDWLVDMMQYLPSEPRTYVYPTPEGGVRLEWKLDSNECYLDVDLRTCSNCEWVVFNDVYDIVETRTMDSTLVEHWK